MIGIWNDLFHFSVQIVILMCCCCLLVWVAQKRSKGTWGTMLGAKQLEKGSLVNFNITQMECILNKGYPLLQGKVLFIPKISNFNFGTLFSFFLCLSYIHFGLPFQEHHIRTGCGTVSVIVYGDPDKPALITYPDLALNCKCSQFIFFYLLSLVSTLYFLFTFCYRICLSFSLGYINDCIVHVCIWKYDSIFTSVYWGRYVMLPRTIFLSRSSFFTASQLLHISYQSSWT